MRIGELGALVGVSARAIRHYHRIGLLPEPSRQPNGYREYSLRDAVELARVRRLSELGLSLNEVRDVLAQDVGRDLVEVLQELDADLARQEEALRQRRARLGQLLRQAQNGGRLSMQAPVSPALTAVFEEMARTAAGLPGPEPAMAAMERGLLALLETNAGSGHRKWLADLTPILRADPEVIARAYVVYELLDDLVQAPETDPRVGVAAAALADCLPPEALNALGSLETLELDTSNGFAAVIFADFAPAQIAVVRRAIELLRERAR